MKIYTDSPSWPLVRAALLECGAIARHTEELPKGSFWGTSASWLVPVGSGVTMFRYPAPGAWAGETPALVWVEIE